MSKFEELLEQINKYVQAHGFCKFAVYGTPTGWYAELEYFLSPEREFNIVTRDYTDKVHAIKALDYHLEGRHGKNYWVPNAIPHKEKSDD